MTQLRKYAIIVGQGRSGSNWLLNLFDKSPLTFCRDEPDLIPGSPLGKLTEDQFILHRDQPAMHAQWDDAVAWTIDHMGSHDNPIEVPKRFLYEPARRLGIYRLVRGPRYRAVLSKVLPSLRHGEWLPPWFIISRSRFKEALPILKFVSPPGWASFVLKHRPQVAVIHIVRHPGGFLNSWASRYLATRVKDEVDQANRDRLHKIVREAPCWGERFGDIEAMNVQTSELWYWLYLNEEIDRAGRDSAMYTRITYEQLVADPVGQMRHLFARLDLPFTDEVSRAIEADAEDSGKIATQWRNKLTAEDQALVERILDSTFMRDWWTQTPLTSTR
ncbi:MAG: sulfotransferase [Planctomycetes bacterium]|nr:sulfotransferase [Planctomycetota bacterium]